jgi:hypothetical protein
MKHYEITKHARHRFIQRCRLLLYPAELVSPSQTMIKLLNQGYSNINLQQSPFYRNKIGCDMIINGRFRFYLIGNTVLTVVLSKKGCTEWRY